VARRYAAPREERQVPDEERPPRAARAPGEEREPHELRARQGLRARPALLLLASLPVSAVARLRLSQSQQKR
jgi:hypothetical protein